MKRREHSRSHKRCRCARSARLWLWRLIILHSTFCFQALGQYSIDWHKIAAGGGTSTGGTYQVTGTIGQPDAGSAMSGGQYSVTGGFWSLIAAVQTPGSPELTVTHSGNSVIVSWPYPSAGFVLQQNNSLSTTNWTASGLTITTTGSTNSISITAPTGTLFFRLAE